MAKVVEFNERNMREFRNLNEALEAFESRISRRKIVRLFQKTYTIRINNLSINVASLEEANEEQRERFFEKVFRNNENLVNTYIAKMKEWTAKFDDKKPIQPIKKGEIAEKA
jgi:hypothetical protein